MITLKKLVLAAGLTTLAAAGYTGAAMAQSTDAFHTIQVFPVVVDTAAFAQRFTFRNPNSTILSVSPTYYPAEGTSQGVALGCPTFLVAAGGDITFSSLRSLCPALAAGSQFGFLYTYEVNTANMPYSAFSRVANPQGNGFSVEAFAANEFTAAELSVTGLRRLAATASNPAFQTNCFVGNLNDYTPPGAPVTSTITLTLTTASGTAIGSATNYNLVAGKITRLLDVFAAVGAPAGDYDNVRAHFSEGGTGEPGIIAFCTVQDNSSFGADFRIAKQEEGFSDALGGFRIGPQDDHVIRDSTVSNDGPTSYFPAGRPFTLLTGGARHNTHLIYFHHPDWTQCELINPATGVRALSAYGLEMRLLSSDGTVLNGGNDVQGWGEMYMGDKTDRDNGVNTRYTIEVENSGANLGADIPYYLHCRSGSGHSLGEIVEYNVASQKF